MPTLKSSSLTVLMLHFLIQISTLLFVLEVRDELFDGLDDLGLGEVVTLEDGFEFLEEGVDFGHLVTGGLLHYAKGLEAIHIDFLAGNIELLVGFLASGITLEVHRWVLRELRVES